MPGGLRLRLGAHAREGELPIARGDRSRPAGARPPERPVVLLELVAYKAARAWYGTEFRYEACCSPPRWLILGLAAAGVAAPEATRPLVHRPGGRPQPGAWAAAIVGTCPSMRYLVPTAGLLAPRRRRPRRRGGRSGAGGTRYWLPPGTRLRSRSAGRRTASDREPEPGDAWVAPRRTRARTRRRRRHRQHDRITVERDPPHHQPGAGVPGLFSNSASHPPRGAAQQRGHRGAAPPRDVVEGPVHVAEVERPGWRVVAGVKRDAVATVDDRARSTAAAARSAPRPRRRANHGQGGRRVPGATPKSRIRAGARSSGSFLGQPPEPSVDEPGLVLPPTAGCPRPASRRSLGPFDRLVAHVSARPASRPAGMAASWSSSLQRCSRRSPTSTRRRSPGSRRGSAPPCTAWSWR